MVRDFDQSGSPLIDGCEIYTVSEIADAIRQNLESEFPDVAVVGEVANFKAHTSGHMYFSLRDERKLIRAVVFRRYVENLSFGPADGMLVIARGRISHYGGSGQTQLLAYNVVPAGRGEMELEFRRLLERLVGEGLTALERKRSIPPYPERIVVITSPTGAVIRDILDTLARRWPPAEVIHIATVVQGPSAADSITAAFEKANRMRGVDLVILARGGGSVEDLWTFNLEEVARAVAGSRNPVITGIGHETDTTICDYVSDLRAATPTAAAELAAPVIGDVRDAVDMVSRRLAALYRSTASERLHSLEYMMRSSAFPALLHRLDRAELELGGAEGGLKGSWIERSGDLSSRMGDLIGRADRTVENSLRINESHLARRLERVSMRNPEDRIVACREALTRLRRVIEFRSRGGVLLRRQGLKGRLRALEGLHPRGVLRRGYSYCTTPEAGRVIGRAAGVEPGDRMRVNFYDGDALCSVERRKKGRSWPRKKSPSRRP